MMDSDPTDPASVFKLVDSTLAPDQATLRFSSGTRNYQLQQSPNLINWSPVPGHETLPGTGGIIEVSTPSSTGFYRIATIISIKLVDEFLLHKCTTMKTKTAITALCVLVGAVPCVRSAPILAPNGDFSTPAGDAWDKAASAGTVISFEINGGNPGGFAHIDNLDGTWGGILVNEGGTGPSPADGGGVLLALLGLTAGLTYTFSLDLINLGEGGVNAGIKMESWAGGKVVDNSGDQNFAITPAWNTYTYDYTIDPTATHVKIVPLFSGAQSGRVGFDNVGVNNTPVDLAGLPPVMIPNGGFETPGGADWISSPVYGSIATFPATGGNPGGHAVTQTANLYAFRGNEVTFASLGLMPGTTYTFQMDMKILHGTLIGGLLIEGQGGYFFDKRPPRIGDGKEWATYSIEFTVPASPSRAKIGLLHGEGIAYDNFKILLPAPPGPHRATISSGVGVSWTAPSPFNAYQPQGSSDNSTWTNLGPLIVGNSVTSVVVDSDSSFYQVLESVPTVQNLITNGGFETQGFDQVEAKGWLGVQSQGVDQRILTDAHTGLACMRIRVSNVSFSPEGSEIQQNTRRVDTIKGTITPGHTYDFSFWAKQISIDENYMQHFKISFLDDIGNIIDDTGFQQFSAPVGGPWTEVTRSGLVAPVGATTALIQIIGVTGLVEGAEGEVYIDDITLVSKGFENPTVLTQTPTVAPAVKVSWPSVAGRGYQVQSSVDLTVWSNVGGFISGDDTIKSFIDLAGDIKKFYKVGELPLAAPAP